MKKLSWFLDRLPGVKPRLASVALKNGLVPGVLEDIHFLHGKLGPSFLVGPDAARLILTAYADARLPMAPGSTPQAASEAYAYLNSEESLRSEASIHRAARENGASPFEDWRRMEEQFRLAGHPIPDELKIDGVSVQRITRGMNPHSADIKFLWRDEDNVEHGLTWAMLTGRRS